jgi:hypothetical protein
VTLDLDLNIWVADQYNHRVCKWSLYGDPQGWFAGQAGFQTSDGTGPTGDWQGFDTPRGVALDGAGYVYVVEQQNHRVSRWQRTSTTPSLGDVTPPSPISDLAFGLDPGFGEYRLTWRSVGDDGPSGRAFMYVIRSSSASITSNADFDAANHHSQGMFPRDSGQPESITLGGFSTNTTHWFAIKVRDEAGNWSSLSNVIAGLSGGSSTGDTTAPGALVDFTASPGSGPGEVDLTWTAVGDDDVTGGPATGYVLKWSYSPITNDMEFISATTYIQTWTPLSSGGNEAYTITLPAGVTVYIAIKAFDEVPNFSSLPTPTSQQVDTPDPPT